MILLGGIVFYSYSSIPFLFHFLVVILINTLFHRFLLISKSKALIGTIVLLNVINLGFFKYFYFFCNFLLQLTGNPFFIELPKTFHLGFPLAISFYTFQLLSLQIDTYRGKIESAIPTIDFFTYLLFFPVLIAGPIMRTTDFFPHLNKKEPERKDIIDATYLMISGVIKKVLIADPLSQTVNPVFQSPMEYGSLQIFLLAYVYIFQLFFDFSGLTDMARSVALYMGIPLPQNFKAPFFSRSLSEFWTRWHITLSTWLRDYLYFPLGGSKVSKARIYLNVVITMTIGGFWHGPDYTFIAWGLYWGIFLGIERFFTEELGWDFSSKSIFSSIFQAFLVTTVAAISTLMFRSNSTQNMIDVFTSLFANFQPVLQNELMNKNEWLVHGMDLIQSEVPFQLKTLTNLDTIALVSVLFILAHIIQYKEGILDRFRKYDPYLVVVLGVLTVFLVTTLSQDGNDFIYYKF
jgi:D-alanyl-lipoteichoic acid acyltransferase DltB (MBOAT superfamily)